MVERRRRPRVAVAPGSGAFRAAAGQVGGCAAVRQRRRQPRKQRRGAPKRSRRSCRAACASPRWRARAWVRSVELAWRAMASGATPVPGPVARPGATDLCFLPPLPHPDAWC